MQMAHRDRLANAVGGPGMGIRTSMYPRSSTDIQSGLFLVPRGPAARPTSYAGALRLRLALPIQQTGADIRIPLEVSAQPNVSWKQLVEIRVDRAVDDQGQILSQSLIADSAEAGAMQVAPFQFQPAINGLIWNAQLGRYDNPEESGFIVRLRQGERPSHKLELMTGTLTAYVQTPRQQLLAVEHVLAQSGKNFTSGQGESLEISEVKRRDDGRLYLRCRLREPLALLVGVGRRGLVVRGNIFLGGRPVVINRLGIKSTAGSTWMFNYLMLRAPAFRFISLAREWSLPAMKSPRMLSMRCNCKPGQHEPERLVWYGQRTVTVEAPFRFSDVSLP